MPDGQVAHFIFHAVPERDREGQVTGVLVLARNIAALKEAEMRLRESREQLRQLAAHRDSVREEERKHIARELHDELGQFLSALRMQASMLRMRFGAGNAALAEHVGDMIRMVDRNIQVVRDIASSLRPTVLDMGIVVALEWQVNEFIKYSGIACDLDITKQGIAMDEHCATTLFRVVQESLTNVARHAGASRVSISLQCGQAHYQLKVKDDGKGFDPDRLEKKTLGLLGMRERVATLGGEIRISSKPGKGTVLEVKIPASRGGMEPPAERAM
jgi:signal transduction histidine kinase